MVQNRDCSNFQVVAKFTILKIVAIHSLFQELPVPSLATYIEKTDNFLLVGKNHPSYILIDRAGGSNVPAETLREPGSRQ